GEPCGNVDNAHALPTVPQAEQKQKKRTFNVLPKPDNLIRYRQGMLKNLRYEPAAGSESDGRRCSQAADA
ncbi:MAG: hypothetical protein WB715_16935, partial [Roseiarcus sp.]|uniref:hypothetical protein n=1 Tax=Roseiarcus sp. TaxID=1969460 RepID=UPI003C5E8A38